MVLTRLMFTCTGGKSQVSMMEEQWHRITPKLPGICSSISIVSSTRKWYSIRAPVALQTHTGLGGGKGEGGKRWSTQWTGEEDRGCTCQCHPSDSRNIALVCHGQGTSCRVTVAAWLCHIRLPSERPCKEKTNHPFTPWPQAQAFSSFHNLLWEA